MTEPTDDTWASSPEQSNRLIEQGILHDLAGALGCTLEPAQVQDLIHTIEAQQAAIQAEGGAWVVDEASRAHLRFTSLMLAGYRVLQGRFPHEEGMALLRHAFIEPLRAWVRDSTAAALDHAPDPLALMTDISKAREAHYYGRTFAFERVQDDRHAYLLNVRRCFYHSFLVAQGAAELMPILCDWDTMTWADAISPADHGFRFERPTTLGYGGDCCRFWFIRQETAREAVL